MSSNLLKVQMKRSRNSTDRMPISCGSDRYQNCCSGVAPSISAASYMSVLIDCMRARMNRNDSGK